MTKYRPEGWEENKMQGFKVYYENEPFEAGADAMLEALRKSGDHIDPTRTDGNAPDTGDFQYSRPGTLVFIPDD